MARPSPPCCGDRHSLRGSQSALLVAALCARGRRPSRPRNRPQVIVVVNPTRRQKRIKNTSRYTLAQLQAHVYVQLQAQAEAHEQIQQQCEHEWLLFSLSRIALSSCNSQYTCSKPLSHSLQSSARVAPPWTFPLSPTALSAARISPLGPLSVRPPLRDSLGVATGEHLRPRGKFLEFFPGTHTHKYIWIDVAQAVPAGLASSGSSRLVDDGFLKVSRSVHCDPFVTLSSRFAAW